MDGYQAFVGIDVCKRSLEVRIGAEGRPFTLTNDRDGLKQLIQQLPEAGSCLVVIESTGGYQRRAVAELVDAGHHVSVVNPRQVRDQPIRRTDTALCAASARRLMAVPCQQFLPHSARKVPRRLYAPIS